MVTKKGRGGAHSLGVALAAAARSKPTLKPKRPIRRHAAPTDTGNAVQQIEAFLSRELRTNESAGILRSENRVIRRLLRATETMAPVYKHLARTLPTQAQRELVVRSIITTTAFRSPRRLRTVGKVRVILMELDRKIAEQANELFRFAELLRKREKIRERYAFDDGEHDGSLIDIIEGAGRNVSPQSIAQPFIARVLPALDELRGVTDPTCWPTFEAVIHELAIHYWRRFGDAPSYDPLDDATRSAMGREASGRTFIRALDHDIQGLQNHTLSAPPAHFRLPHNAVSAIAKAALHLDISAENVRKTRSQAKLGQPDR